MNQTTTTIKDIETDFDYAGSCNTSETGIASLEANLATDTDTDTDNDNNNSNINDKNYQHLLRKKEQPLSLTLQGVHQLHNELERLKQSEAWYRTELRQHQNKQFHSLENDYNQERLCMKCENLENVLLTQHQNTLQKFNQPNITENRGRESPLVTSDKCQELANLQQSALIAEQQLLIDVLRRQKQTLLQELQQLAQEKDEELLMLQANMAHKELEQQRLRAHFEGMQNLQETVVKLQDQVEMQKNLLKQKEQHIVKLQENFHQQLQATAPENVQQVHQLSLDYHANMIEEHQQMKNLSNEFAQLQLTVRECRKYKAHQLIELNARYAELCALCERTRLELELQQEKDHHKQENLQEYEFEMQQLKRRIITLELETENVNSETEVEKHEHVRKQLNAQDEKKDMQDLSECSEDLQKSIEKHREMFCVKAILFEQLKVHLEEEELGNKQGERLTSLQKLLMQQTNKIQILQKAQADWEIVQQQLEDTKKLTDDNAHELEKTRTELEELSSIFNEQNDELQQLHVKHIKLATQETMQKEAANAEIALLKRQLKESIERQQRLQEDMSTDSAATIMQHRQQMRIFKTQVQELLQVREEQQARLLNLERELKRHKRRALLIPEPMEANNSEMHPTKVTTILKNAKSFDEQINDRLRILSKVLQAEHARQMQRYDLHIRSLLRHVKGLKKALHAAEKKLLDQTADNQKAMLQVQAQLQDMHFKDSQSQQIINNLQQAIKKERREFAAKSSTSQFKVDSSEHVMDDMKNLIEQSAAATGRPSTQTVLQLIQRSEQCVPKLHKLENAVSQLCNDVHTIVNVQKIRSSLFEEVSAASEIKCQIVI